MPLIGGNEKEKEKDTVVAGKGVAAAAAVVAPVVSEWCLSYAPRGKRQGQEGWRGGLILGVIGFGGEAVISD